MAFENGVLPEDWRPAAIVPLHKSKGVRTEYSNYRCYYLVKCGWKNRCRDIRRQSS